MSGTVGSVGGNSGSSAAQTDFEFQVLCDINAGTTTKFLRRFKTDSAGVTTKIDTRLDGTTAYVPLGSVTSCDAPCETAVILCDNTGSFLRRYGCDGVVRDFTLDGTTAYVTVGTVKMCKDKRTFAIALCDVSATGVATRFLRRYDVDQDGVVTVTNTNLGGIAAYVPSGTVTSCESSLDSTSECFTAIFDDTGITAGDRIIRVTVFDTSTSPTTVKLTSYLNQNTGLILSSVPTLGWLRPCDTELSTFTICYRAKTAGTGWDIGDTLYMIRVVDYTVVTSGTTVDVGYFNATTGGQVALTPSGPLPGVDLIECGDTDIQFVQLCDNVGGFLRRIIRGPDGSYAVADFTLDGTTPYTTSGTVTVCNARPIQIVDRCDDTNGDGAPDTAYKSIVQVNQDGTIVVLANYETDLLTAYAPVSQTDCIVPTVAQEILCDNNGSFLRYYVRDSLGAVTVADKTLDGTTNYTTVGTVKLCADDDLESVDFCLRANTVGVGYAVGDQLKVTRWFNPATNLQVGEVAFNMTQGGVVVATPLVAANFDECPAGGGASETLVCAAGVTLIRRVDSITGVVTFIGINGAAVATPAAYTIGGCFSGVDFETLCDNNGSFLRRYNRNPDGTISVVNTTLDGVTAYVPVGIVRRCDSYAIESHIFNVAAGTSWTPANIPAGKILIGLGFSVISGTATVTDADGTAVTLLPTNYSDSWNATVNGNLVPPQSIAAAAASRVVVTMSVR
jgi:hypothetical protein